MARRVIALMLALCFGLFSVEALVADVHDGDARVAQLTSGYGEAVDGVLIATATNVSENVHTHENSPSTSGHSIHVCHASHAHVGLITTGARLDTTMPELRPARTARVSRIDDARPEPQLRPPIA